MRRSIAVVKAVHALIFVVMSVLLGVLLYDVIVGRITPFTWTAVAVFAVEGLVLLANGWKCPLTRYAEELGSPHGQVTDLLLPKWCADRVFLIYGTLFAAAVLGLAARLWG